MSVINQMLKDLDERQSEQQHSQANQIPMKKAEAPWKLITLIIIMVIALNIAGIFFWQLYSENKSLKTISENSYQQNQQAKQLIEGQENKLLTSKSAPSVQNNNDIAHANTNTIKNDKSIATISQNAEQKLSKQLPSVDSTLNEQPNKLSNEQRAALNQQSATQSTNVIEQKVTEKVVVKNEPIVELNHLAVKDSIESGASAEKPAKPSLSISRKQLTAAELTQQKIDQAEQALAENQLTKAEKLFEDVLLMTPEHKAARKQLAALWFGREAYQPAINVLSQGIQLYPDDSEFRLMKARIYLNQGQTIAAVNTLKDLAYVENVEYQALLASHAQQISQFDIATSAYQLLTKLEPNAGRWWLGLAVAYDSNSEFDQAVKAYDQAIDKSDLSENARQFARQRVQELGE